MIYKPNAVSPDMETVKLQGDESDPYVTFSLSGITSSDIYETGRITLSNVETNEEDISDFCTYVPNILIDTSKDFYKMNFSLSKSGNLHWYNGSLTSSYKYTIQNDKKVSWKMRLYEKKSFDDNLNKLFTERVIVPSDDSPDSDDTQKFIPKMHFNYSEINDTESNSHLKFESYGDESYYCSKYFPTTQIAYGNVLEDLSYTVYNNGYRDCIGHIMVHSQNFGKNIKSNSQTYKDVAMREYISYNYAYTNTDNIFAELKFYYNTGEGIGYVDEQLKILKIFPHNFHNAYMLPDKVLHIPFNNYGGANTKYYIKLQNKYFKILDWAYYNFAEYTGCIDSNGDYFNKKSCGKVSGNSTFNSKWVDSYGNPLAMYVLIRVPNDIAINEGDDYTIYCNYIDTDTYSFEINDPADISFCETHTPDTAIDFYTNKDDALSAPYKDFKYSNLSFKGTYFQNSGAEISKYNVLLQRIGDNGTLETIEKISNRFSYNLYYSYDDFKNGETYLLTFEITNNRNVTDTRHLCIIPNYGIESNLIKAEATLNKRHNSVIVDFSKLFSIESDAQTAITENDFHEESVNNKSFNYLNVASNNSLTYSRIDGKGDLEIAKDTEDFVCNIVVRLHNTFKRDIISVTDDAGNTYTLTWDGVQIFQYHINKNGKDAYFEYYPYSAKNNYIFVNDDIDNMMSALETSDVNTSTPYCWSGSFDEQEWNDNLYWHEESMADTYWWSIIIYSNGVLFKNLSVESSEWKAAKNSTASLM